MSQFQPRVHPPGRESAGDQDEQREVAECTFVPLLGRFGWSGEAPRG